MRKLKVVSVFVLLALLLSANWGVLMAQESLPPVDPDAPEINEGEPEKPRELTEAEYQQEVADLYARYPDFIEVVNLKDPNGIDPRLLPPDVASLVDSNTKIVAFREMTRPDSERAPGLESPRCISSLNIWCKSPDGSRDMTVSSMFRTMEQFTRVYALRYDNSPAAPNNKGWEIENQWALWYLHHLWWVVRNARMKTKIPGQDYCTGNDATLDHYSSLFDPRWPSPASHMSMLYGISGFPNNAYVPHTSGWSRTQADLIWFPTGFTEYGYKTYQYWEN